MIQASRLMIAEFLEVTFSRHGTCKLLYDTSLALARSSPTRRYTGILLTGPTKLFGNEVCKIDGGPSAKHEDRSQILQAEFPNNFVRLRSVRCFLHAAVPDVVFDGIRPLFRLKITWILDDEILDIEEEARRLTEESSPKM